MPTLEIGDWFRTALDAALTDVTSHQRRQQSFTDNRLSAPEAVGTKLIGQMEQVVLTAVRRCHHEVQSTAGSEAQSSGDNNADHPHRNANSNPRLATEKQVRAIHAMADRQNIDLKDLLHDRFSVASAKALTIRQASELIDELKRNFQSV